MNHDEESTKNQQLICSECNKEITDEHEYYGNDGVCDECYSIPVRKRRGLIIS